MDTTSIGLTLESHKDSDDDSKKMDWGFIFSVLKNRGFSHQEILKLTYPQFNAYMNNITNSSTYNVVIPYLGSGEKEDIETIKKDESSKLSSKQELMSIVASMNSDFN